MLNENGWGENVQQQHKIPENEVTTCTTKLLAVFSDLSSARQL
jgi:hypothetical protein